MGGEAQVGSLYLWIHLVLQPSLSLVIPLPSESIRVHLILLQTSEECLQFPNIHKSSLMGERSQVNCSLSNKDSN